MREQAASTRETKIAIQTARSLDLHMLPRALLTQFAKGTGKVLVRVEDNQVQGTLWKLNMSC